MSRAPYICPPIPRERKSIAGEGEVREGRRARETCNELAVCAPGSARTTTYPESVQCEENNSNIL